jgi:hypothetical protein
MVQRIYRYLDKLHKKHKEQIQKISYQTHLQLQGNQLSMVFYDVTILYFEIEGPDELRKIGFSKDGNHQHHKSCWTCWSAWIAIRWPMKFLWVTSMKG